MIETLNQDFFECLQFPIVKSFIVFEISKVQLRLCFAFFMEAVVVFVCFRTELIHHHETIPIIYPYNIVLIIIIHVFNTQNFFRMDHQY